MALKFGRQFQVAIETNDGQIALIESPTTLDFNVNRNNLASANTASFTLYNLNEKTRKRLFKDQFDVTTRRAIQVRAGYGRTQAPGYRTSLLPDDVNPTILKDFNKLNENFPIIFNGEIRHCYSERQGVDFRTEIECFDGGFAIANGFTNTTIGPNTSYKELFKQMAKSMPGISESKIGDFVEKISKRGAVMFGSTAELFKEFAGDNFTIDNNQVQVLGPDEVIENQTFNLINSANGLLNTPKRGQAKVEVTMLFEPRLIINQAVRLETETADILNGIYKVTGIQHSGTISGAVGGVATTTVQLYSGTKIYRVISGQ